MAKKNKEEVEFSKKLLLQESALIWIITFAFIILAFVCIANQYFGELPWITAMAACPWGAYAVSQAAYYKKAEKENTKGGIKYESVMHQLQTQDNAPPVPEEEFVENALG
jgi:positive regulator of sigma E activity